MSSLLVAVLFNEPRIFGGEFSFFEKKEGTLSLILVCELTNYCSNFSEDATGYGPIFEEEPVDVVYTEDSPDKRISMNCRARANPPASYRFGK